MHYEIHRGWKFSKTLSTAQRTSSLFAEEPVVLGKVFRRGYPPMVLSEEQFERNKISLSRLEKAGAIVIKKLQEQAPQVMEPQIPIQPPPPPQVPAVEPEKTKDPEKEPPAPIQVEQVSIQEEVVATVPEAAVDASKNKKGKNK